MTLVNCAKTQAQLLSTSVRKLTAQSRRSANDWRQPYGILPVRWGADPADEVVQMTYEDRYLKSPASLRLCLDTLGKIRSTASSLTPLTIRTFPVASASGSTRWISDDWHRENDRSAVANAYAAARGLKLDLQTSHPEHGRRLVLRLKSGREYEIVLDQGFGAWRCDRGVAFDFSRPTAEQLRQLKALNCGARLPPGARTYIVAGIH